MKRAPLIFSIAMVSGACALVYQVVWMRVFLHVFGLSIYSTTTVVSAFMGGLGLGSWLAPRLIDRWKGSYWKLYALIEVGIAIGAVIVPMTRGPITSLFLSVSDATDSNFVIVTVKFLSSFAVMLPPTLFMGLTLPVLIQACRGSGAEEKLSTKRIGYIYGFNTAGAALGCVMVGFVLLYLLGVQNTVLSVAALNLAIAGIVYFAFVRGRNDESPVAEVDDEGLAPTAVSPVDTTGLPRPSTILIVYGLIGVTSFGFEMSWFRLLTFYLQSATYSFSTMLAIYLVGLGLGSLIYSRLIDDRLQRLSPAKTATLLGFIEVVIGLLGLATLPLCRWIIPGFWGFLIDVVGADGWGVILFQKAMIASVIVLPPTLLMGIAFPLVARIYKAHGTADSKTVGHLYAVNTVGAIVGSVGTGFVLFNLVGIQWSLVILSFLSLGIGLTIANRSLRSSKRVRASFATCAAMALAAVFITPGNLFRDSFAQHVGKVLFYRESASDITLVYEHGNGHKFLAFHDGRGTSGTATYANYFNRQSAYTAMFCNPEAKNVLVISMGCGNTSSAFTAFPIERLDIVDISSGPFEAAPYFHTNNNVIEDPRVHLNVEDGRNYLLRTKRKFDIISLELPSLHTDGVVNLYTKEFYEIARARLNDGGVLSQWIDPNQSGADITYMLLNTMRQVFPNTTAWGYEWAWWGIASKHDGPLKVHHNRILPLVQDPRVKADMATVGGNMFDSLALIAGAGEPLLEFIEDAPVLTDDKTIVDFLLPKIDLPSAVGGGVAYYNSPFVELFKKSWKKEETRHSGLIHTYLLFKDRHNEVMDASVPLVIEGFPPQMTKGLQDLNDKHWKGAK